ncbi:MAG: extracellular solute-binding protein [Thermofilum sp.]|uniref:extracellular solute-binding protein n=1 Tax=Thermofilum sp. TaxID=1961369 RepID=UPI0031806EE5
MKRYIWLISVVLFGTWAGLAAPERVTLLYMTAGDINMLALAQNVLGPMFAEKYPEVELRTVHTGPGDAGSQLILEKLRAEKLSGKATWDVDVAMVHQVFMSWAMAEGDLLLQYAQDLETWKYVTSPHAKYALGTLVEGYVMPMFHSQVAIAYNPKYVPNPPRSYEELVEWVKANPGKFGYNGIKGGMSGVAFVVGWVYWKSGKYEKYAITGPYDEAEVASWEPIFKELKEFNKYVTITAGNVGTLDALNRGEIWMGPVWVDMFYTFMLTGKMDPNIRLVLPAPGLPGQPMYFVIPKKARNIDWAKKFVEFVTSPEIQAKVIVEMYNWYPGIDGTYIKDYVSPEAYARLYRDITPEELREKGLSFALAKYHTAILEAYEKWTIGG